MAEPTLQQLFGANATQTSTTITITKGDLPTITPTANNTAESIFVAIVLKGEPVLSKESFDTTIEQSIYISPGFPGFTNRGTNNDSYRVDQLTINLAKLDTASIINANDY